MVNISIIFRILGSLLFLESSFMAICFAMAVSYEEDDMMAFLISIILTTISGLVLKYLGRKSDNNLGRRDAYLLVTLTWIIFSILGMLPYVTGGYIPNITNAFFETISGFTTTGCSILDNVENLPHGILFWRSLTQWIGGLGIVFFTIAILPSMVGGSVKVFSAEATGPIKSKMHPRLSTSAKWIWSIYIALTIGCMTAFYFFGMDVFDSINYAMTTTATGGFSLHNNSTSFFQSAAIDYTSIIFQFLSGINFLLLYSSIFKFRVSNLLNNSEFRLYLTIIIFSTAWIMYLLIDSNGYDWEHALRSSLFQVISFITTTGLANDDPARWPHITWIILGILMFIGGCGGSTSGGFKCIRLSMVLTILKNEFRHILHPNAVLPIKLNGQSIPSSKIPSLLAFLTALILMGVVTATIMIASGVDTINSIVISLSCMSNVGPSLANDIGPSMSWNSLPDITKWCCSFLMLMGRLEIIGVLVIFTRGFWKDS